MKLYHFDKSNAWVSLFVCAESAEQAAAAANQKRAQAINDGQEDDYPSREFVADDFEVTEPGVVVVTTNW